MRFKTSLTAMLCLISISFAHGQIFKNISLPPVIQNVIKDLTFEVGINKSKVFNTKKIRSFLANRKGRSYQVNIKKEFYPITTNYNMSLGYRITKKHHIRIRHANNTLGSRLDGSLQIIRPPTPISTSTVSFTMPLEINHTKLKSTSLGILYEYQTPLHEGNIVIGAGLEKQINDVVWETLVLPGIGSRSFSFHSHIGYLSEPISFIQIHGKVFSTYYISNKHKVYDTPINSSYVPLQLGFEIGFRLNFKNVFPHSKQNKNRRRRRKMYFIKPY